MELDIRKLLLENGPPLTGDAAFDLSKEDFGGFSVPQAATMHYTATPKNGVVTLVVRVNAELSAECARCLTPAIQPFSSENEYRIRETDFDEAVPDLPLSPGGMLDLKELCYGEIVLDAPQVLLCSEDCKGLCPRCGKRRAECQCPPDEGDLRLAALRQLLKN